MSRLVESGFPVTWRLELEFRSCVQSGLASARRVTIAVWKSFCCRCSQRLVVALETPFHSADTPKRDDEHAKR
uniref:Uncharacterized protein n=1 Tax=Timema douglasi TaxID=61478 RepID=A0A7R8Z752_TIMDO|nr:unnamed protein product [Timema douglasi]